MSRLECKVVNTAFARAYVLIRICPDWNVKKAEPFEGTVIRAN